MAHGDTKVWSRHLRRSKAESERSRQNYLASRTKRTYGTLVREYSVRAWCILGRRIGWKVIETERML